MEIDTKLLFEEHAAEGFQDIWITDLSNNEIIECFLFVCNFCSNYEQEFSFLRERTEEDEIYDLSHTLENFWYGNENFKGICVRIQHYEIAIDFDGGLEYWNKNKRNAFICWLKELSISFPAAKFSWSREGNQGFPDEKYTQILQQAIKA